MKSCRHPCCGPVCRKKKPNKRRNPIKKVSHKQAKRNLEYSKERKNFLSEGDLCEARLKGCTGVATEIHHKRGRIGKNLTDRKGFLKVCHSCHCAIELNPDMAKEKGLSESRLIK